MKKYGRIGLALVLGLALILSACSLFQGGGSTATVQWITNYTGLEVDTPSGSTHVALDVDQVGEGDIVDFKDGGTTVYQIADGGASTQTGGGFDVDVTGAASIDADLASNFSASVGDITIDAETGSVNIIGSEADASAIHLDANDTVTSGINIDTGTVSGMAIDGGPFSVDGTGAFNVNTASGDITVEAETGSVTVKGDEANAAAVFIDANAAVASGVDIDTGTTSGLTIDGGPFSVDGTGAFNVNTASGDITVEAETGSVIIKGDEEVADAILLDANTTITQGVDIDVGSVHGMSVDGGLTDFGSGTYTTANGDGDVGINGDLEVNTNCDFDGEMDVDGTTNLDTVDIDGAINIAGQTITWDGDGDTTSVASEDDVITYTLGTAAGYIAVATGNLVVGTPGSASLALNGNDGYFEGTLEADGLARLDGGATLGAGDLTISNGSFFPDFTDAVVSDGDTITPTAYMRSISCSGNITFTLGASCTDGQPLVIYIDDSHNVVIMATNSKTAGGGNITVDQYDTVGYICEDNTWIMLYESNNS